MMKSFLLTGLTALTALGALPACAADQYATGPIPMSEVTLAGYAKYLKLSSPGYFAVAINGRGYGYTYCANGNNCSNNGSARALELCRAYAKTEKCVIYAYGGKPVFGGNGMPPLAVDRPKTQAAPPTMTPPPGTSSNAESRLRELQSLRDKGFITQQEFDDKRRAIVGKL